MAKKKYYRKLVRDRLPEIIAKEGDEAFTKILTVKQYQLELKRKIIEEAKKVKQAKTKTEVIHELADIIECIDALTESYGVPRYALEREQREKRARRGGFTKRIYLLATSR